MTGSARRIAAPVVAVLAAVFLLGAVTTAYVSHAFFDADGFSERATAGLADEAVEAEIARRVTDDVVLNADADLVAVRPVIESVVSGLVGAGAFQSLFESGVADVHRAVFEGEVNSATLTLVDLGVVLRGALQALAPQVARKIKAKSDVSLSEIEPPDWLADVVQVADDVEALEWILIVLAVVLGVLAVWISPDRRRTALTLGIAVALAGVVAAVGLGVVRAVALARIDETGVRDAGGAIWDAFLGDLRTGYLLFAAAGAVIAAGASSLLRPVELSAPLRRAWDLVATVPETTRMRALRAVLLVAAGVLIIVRHQAAIEIAVVLTGLYVAYAGVSELMRLTVPGPAEGEPEPEGMGAKRALLSAAIAAGVIMITGAIFVAGGGTDEGPEAIDTVGCNGSLELCERPIDDVVFAGTHNAMSAVTNKGWLFGQQDAGFADQLHDGIRALFIDAHYGVPTEDGAVKTDLSEVGVGERDTYSAEVGTEALDAALRTRDRLVGSEPSGPRQVYLCHRFCELGAIPIVDAFRQLRDFMAANPDEVVVVVIEDYVDPDEIAEAAEESGLIDYVYEGRLEPAPTLGEIVDSGGRAVIMAENDAGGDRIPWYHPTYDRLVEETPFSFDRPPALIGKRALRSGCRPNRGPRDAPLFLINHWVDTSPAPRPSNAAKVNAAEALLRRVRACERIRGLDANLISVDFYREGDVFDVVERLNADAGG